MSFMSPFDDRAYQQLPLLGGEMAKRQSRRVALDATSWVEHLPDWLCDDGTLLQLLLEEADWEQRTRWMYTKSVTEPRLTAEYPILQEAPVQRVREIGALLSTAYGVPYDRAWLNLYRDHNDSTAWHADRQCLLDHCLVPVLSLGHARRFLVRPKGGGRSITFLVRNGDLVVMGGRCQKDWVHSVPKESVPAGPRISINFASKTQAASRD